MAILEKTVWVSLASCNTVYYEKLNYHIPRYKNRDGQLAVKRGTKIEVKVEDLMRSSSTLVTKVCDICGIQCPTKQTLRAINESRLSTDGKDRCKKCGNLRQKETINNKDIPAGLSLLERFPDLSSEYHPTKNDFSADRIYAQSSIDRWWICPNNPDHDYSISPNERVIFGCGCPYCSGHKVNNTNCLATTHPELLEEWNYIKNDTTPFEISHGSRKRIWWKCKTCRHEWESVLGSRTRTSVPSGCPNCNESRGEKRIREYLINSKVFFSTQHSFYDLSGVGGGMLRFDFSIFDNNKKLIFLIEYDGEFHYEKFYEEQNFDELQLHDQLKNDYCTKNNIPLIRIPYWEFDNIEQILDEHLTTYLPQETTSPVVSSF